MSTETVNAIFLDHASTTPVDERVLAAMLPYFSAEFGNPASIHGRGQAARKALEEARERVAEAIGARPRDVIFTSGATEADNQAVMAATVGNSGGLVVSTTEHPAVLEAARRAAHEGRDVSFVPPAPTGEIPLAALEAALKEQALRDGTALVALMHVNNETGVMSEPAKVAELAHAYGALYLCDAVQGLGVQRVDIGEFGADLLTLSAHKVYGPKGAGALVVRPGLEPRPLLSGGDQERGFRPGTHNLPAIVGFGKAATLAVAQRENEHERLGGVQRAFERAVLELPGARLNSVGTARSVKHSNVHFAGVDGEILLMLLDRAGVQASAGSACSAGSVTPSHVLTAMGLSRADAKASLRFSFGKLVEEADALAAVEIIGRALPSATVEQESTTGS